MYVCDSERRKWGECPADSYQELELSPAIPIYLFDQNEAGLHRREIGGGRAGLNAMRAFRTEPELFPWRLKGSKSRNNDRV